MKRVSPGVLVLMLTALFALPPAWALEDNDDPAKTGDLQALQRRITRLEAALEKSGETPSWTDRIAISGLIEVEAVYERIDVADDDDADNERSDVDLATVELAVDATITPHVSGHVLFKYEDDDVFVDEGFITLTGSETYPAYLIAGRQYLPFGRFDTHFVSDPLTLELGEINEGAVVIGYRFGGERVDVAIGAFNDEVQAKDADDHVGDLVASVVVTPLEDVAVGAAVTSNLAAAGGLADALTTDELDDSVAGWSLFASVTVMDRVTLIAEYVAALEHFSAGELYTPDDTQRRRPAAWNLELGVAITDDVEVAVRYGGSSDGDAGEADFLPQAQYGGVVNWGVFKNTILALEYLHGEYEDDFQTSDTVTAQLAIEF